MKIMTIECDGCHTTKNVGEYKIYTGKESDPSGNGYNTIWDYKDFCFECLKNYIVKYGNRVKIEQIKSC